MSLKGFMGHIAKRCLLSSSPLVARLVTTAIKASSVKCFQLNYDVPEMNVPFADIHLEAYKDMVHKEVFDDE